MPTTIEGGAPRGLLIAAVVLAFVLPPVGLVLGLVARHQDRRAGAEPDVLATVAIIGSLAMLVLTTILVVALLVAAFTVAV